MLCRFGFGLFLSFTSRLPCWFAFILFLLDFFSHFGTFVACQCLPAIDVVYISSLPHLYVTITLHF
jgi:hypothetical protein